MALLATFAAGGLALPLLPTLPLVEHEYMTQNSETSILLYDKPNEGRANDLQKKLQSSEKILVQDYRAKDDRPEPEAYDMSRLPKLADDRKAMMLYTSGTVRATHIKYLTEPRSD